LLSSFYKKDRIPYFDTLSASGGFDIHYSIFAFFEFLYSIKLAAFQASGGADVKPSIIAMVL